MSASLIRDARGKQLGGERQRVVAIQQLDKFATGAILDPLLHALEDVSPQVRREALRICFEREVVACIPGAATLWSDGGEPSVRVAALKVLALDPEPSRAAILIEALRDTSEVIRAQAADYLGTAPLAPDMRRRARKALLAKLADISVVVRRRAVLSLGRLGPGEGTLSIARLLSDPEPTVRAAAAEALGHYRDATAVPALRRAIASSNEPAVAREIIEALAVLPDPTVEADLLALLDDPPSGMEEIQIAAAMGRRPAPGTALIEGLVARLDEPIRRDAALHALLLLGQDSRDALQAAYDRGLAPATEVEVERLLAALSTDTTTEAPSAWPKDDDRPAWRHRLNVGDAVQQRRVAWTLAQRDPAWRTSTALAVLAQPGPLAGREGWVLTLAASPTPWAEDHDAEPVARLQGWARDRRTKTERRCLAIAALGARVPSDRHGVTPWSDLAADPDPRVRACVALASGRQGDAQTLAGLLLDDHARVRAAAALALATVPPRHHARSTRTRLALLAVRDPDGAVRAAASLARDLTEALPGAPGMFAMRVEPFAWRSPPTWIEVSVGERSLWVPTVGSSRWRWALVPGLASATAQTPVETFAER